MPSNKKTQTPREQLRLELERSLLLEPADRNFWLENLNTLPPATVVNLLAILVSNNAQVDDYVETALAQDQNGEHLAALKAQIATIKQQAFQKEEQSVSQTEEQQGEALLSELEDM